MTDHDHLDHLKAAADPLRVAAALGLRGRGSRFFCPVCQPSGGKTPDLVIGDKGFVCHKCGEKGDILKLIMVAQDMTFPSAVAWLEREAGIAPPRRPRHRTGGHPSRTGIVEPGANLGAISADPVHKPIPEPDPAVYEAFLTACRPVEGRPLDWLKERGVTEDIVKGLGLRFCGREYQDIMAALKERFGEAALLFAGLLKRSKAGGRLVPSFWHYYAKKKGFLVIPYLLNGRPVYLKVRPPVSKEGAERLGLVRFLNTAARVPCLYNADILTTGEDESIIASKVVPGRISTGKPDRVLICEGESDTWTALSHGFAAVGSPGARSFKAAWVEGFRGIEDAAGRSRVFLVMDADKAGGEGSRIIADLFLKAGLPVPLKLILPPGMDLTEYMKDGRTF